MRSASFSLHTDCLPGCDQSPFKRDWSILLGLEKGTRTIPKFCPFSFRDAFRKLHDAYRDVFILRYFVARYSVTPLQ